MTKTKSVMLGKISVRELHGPWVDFMNKLQGEESEKWFDAFKKFLRKENPWPAGERKWRNEDGIIRFSVEHRGIFGRLWVDRLKGKNFHITASSESVLCSDSFKPFDGLTTEVAVLRGIKLEKQYHAQAVRTKAAERGWGAVNVEVACLIREKFSDNDIAAMGLRRIVVMHAPIADFSGDLTQLCVSALSREGFLSTWTDHVETDFDGRTGFAFQVSAQVTDLSVL